MRGEKSEHFAGEFRIDSEVYQDMNNEAESKPKRETGGMLFGSFDEGGENLKVSIEKVELIPDEAATRTTAHFGIEPSYSDQILNEYCPEYTYLGNWHSHLSYGGPSQGDYQQVSRFFETNQNRDYMIAVILDRRNLNPPDFELIAEVYQRAKDEESNSNKYIKKRVKEAYLYDTPSDYDPDHRLGSIVSGLECRRSLASRLESLADRIAETTPVSADHDDAMAYIDTGGQIEEVVLCLPVQYRFESGSEKKEMVPVKNPAEVGVEDNKSAAQKDEGSSEEEPEGDHEDTDSKGSSDTETQDLVDAYLTVSVPLVYPADKIFVDLASRDLMKQLTIHTTEASVLKESVDPFVQEIDSLVREKTPKLLLSPLSEVIRSDSE